MSPNLGFSPLLLSLIIMDNILFWNARGAGSNEFKAAVVDLIKLNSVDFLFICEPRVQFSKVDDHFSKLGFNMSEIVEASRFSGGLWAMWNNTRTQIDVYDATTRSISLKISSNHRDWILTCLYASPCKPSRQELWDYLATIHSTHQFP